MFKLAVMVASVSGVVLKQQPFGDQDSEYVSDTAERNAMNDCSGGSVAPGTVGASNDMAMRVVAAKVSAMSGDEPPKDFDSFSKGVKTVSKFKRYAGQDCEKNGKAEKKDMSKDAPYSQKRNFHGPDSQVEKANDVTREALEKVVQIKREVLGEQFAKVEGAP